MQLSQKRLVMMTFNTKRLKVNDKITCDLESLFAQLLVVGSKRSMELSTLFEYELSPVPASIINEYGCLRKGNKSVLVQRLGILEPNPPVPDVILIDASQLIYHMVWPLSGTVSDLAAGMGHWLNATTPKHLSFLTGMSKCLPKTTRGRGEPGRAPQSTDFHCQPFYLAATK